jgi:transposase InsO family protein
MRALADKLSVEHSVSLICSTLGLARSTRYHDGSLAAGARRGEDEEIKAEISRIYLENKKLYGAPRILLALRGEERRHSKRRVARLMGELGIRGRSRGRKKPSLTDSRHKGRVAPNKLGEIEEVKEAHSVWVSDTTYIKGKSQWLYLAATMDYYSRTIVGWEVSATNDAELTSKALRKAIESYPARRPLHHSDRGSTYACKPYMDELKKVDGIASMSRKGNCYDNAAMESFFGTLKAEWIGSRGYSSLGECRADLFEYIESFYNTRRIHTSIGMSPRRKLEDANNEPSRKALRPAASSPCGKVALDIQAKSTNNINTETKS